MHIPYWWSGSRDDLAATIKHYAPHIPLTFDGSSNVLLPNEERRGAQKQIKNELQSAFIIFLLVSKTISTVWTSGNVSASCVSTKCA